MVAGGWEPHGARLSHVLIFVLAPALDKNTWRAEVHGAWCLGGKVAGCCLDILWWWFAGWMAGWLLGWLRVVVLKVGERLAGGTLARVYNASTGLYDAL